MKFTKRKNKDEIKKIIISPGDIAVTYKINYFHIYFINLHIPFKLRINDYKTLKDEFEKTKQCENIGWLINIYIWHSNSWLN